MTDQLLPCPFCGKQPRHVPADYVDNAGRPWPFAECDPCHVGSPVEFWNTRAQHASEPKPVDDEEAFEQWHDSFYGPQDPYNPIRSLEKHSELGYSDGVVTAQFAAFKGGRAHPAPAGVVLPDPESADVCPYWTDGQQRHAWIQGFKNAAGRLNGVKP